MALSAFKQKIGAAAFGVASIALPFTANAQQAAPVANKPVATQNNDNIEVSPIQLYDPEKEGMNVHRFMRKQSENGPVLLIFANGRDAFLNAAGHAEEIQRHLKSKYGYDVKVWAVKAEKENVASITPYYKGLEFLNGQRIGTRTPAQALKESEEFGVYCKYQDHKNVASLGLNKD